jgi:hypothetical protein
VPEVQAIATGRPLALAAPSAKNALARSSMWECARSRGLRASASTSGVEREPGEVQASVIPQRASSSTKAAISWWEPASVTGEPYPRARGGCGPLGTELPCGAW